MKLVPYSTLVLLVTSQLLAASASFADDKWDDKNDPLAFDYTYVTNYDQLPKFGTMAAKNRGWADTYWPADLGYVADRWQQHTFDPSNEDSFKDRSFKEEVSPSYNYLMALDEQTRTQIINTLSPAEKFDLARGATDYPLTSDLRKNAKTSAADWHGVCNGWSQASMNIDEPHPFVYENKQLGIKIPFASGDLKGLLAYYYANFDNSPTKSIGISCRRTLGFGNGGCGNNDVNAGAFHIMMANELGLRHLGFTADSDPSSQVWNQPYTQYVIDDSKTRDYTGGSMSHAADGAVLQREIHADVTYTEESYTPHLDSQGNPRQYWDKNQQKMVTEAYDMGIPVPTKDPVLGTPLQAKATYVAHYAYVLDLDAWNNIIGGRWLSYEKPDLIWKQQFNKPTGDYALLNDLIAQATAYSAAQAK